MGNEGDYYDSLGNIADGDAGYPSSVVDWVLVSLRETADGAGGSLCQSAALLHSDGHIELVDEVYSCCGLDLGVPYYLVIEHRSHLVIMSHEPVDIVSGKLTYDFRIQQSYVDDPFGFGIFAQQKEITPGTFVMLGSNGEQASSANDDTDITDGDRAFWEDSIGIFGKYEAADYNLNGDVNVNDRKIWEENNGKFTSVPRD